MPSFASKITPLSYIGLLSTLLCCTLGRFFPNAVVVSMTTHSLSHPRALARASSSFLSTWTSSKLGLNPLGLGRTKKKTLLSRKPVVQVARSESQGVSLGFRAHAFELQEPLTGKMWTLEDFEQYPALLVMFICNHCPFVKHPKKDIVKLATFYMQDGPEFLAEEAKILKYPYLYNESQEVAKDFRAVCTPEFLLFKKDGRRPFELVYGTLDEAPSAYVIDPYRPARRNEDIAPTANEPSSMPNPFALPTNEQVNEVTTLQTNMA